MRKMINSYLTRYTHFHIQAVVEHTSECLAFVFHVESSDNFKFTSRKYKIWLFKKRKNNRKVQALHNISHLLRSRLQLQAWDRLDERQSTLKLRMCDEINLQDKSPNLLF